MRAYLDLLAKLLDAPLRTDRTGVGTRGLFAQSMEFDLADGFPLLTTKKVAFRNTVNELLWFVSGSTNINALPRETRHWWQPWASEDGSVGPIYGRQLRHSQWEGLKSIDPLAEAVRRLKHDPTSRRHVLTCWNAAAMELANLPCCHGTVIQFYVREERYLDLFTHQRSADCFIGLPVNIASYSLLASMVAQVAKLTPGRVTYSLGDAHLYLNHINQAHEQITRQPRKLPKLMLDPSVDDLFAFRSEHIAIDFYHPLPAIKAPVAV